MLRQRQTLWLLEAAPNLTRPPVNGHLDRLHFVQGNTVVQSYTITIIQTAHVFLETRLEIAPLRPLVNICKVSQCIRPTKGMMKPLVAPITLPLLSPVVWGTLN